MSRPSWEALVAPLDRGRQMALGWALGSRPLSLVLARRDLRIAILGAVGALIATGLAVVAPVFLFVLGPILLGVPHVASDARYLVVRRALPTHVRAAAWVGCAVLLFVRIAEEARLFSFPLERVELLLAAAWIFGAAILGGCSGPKEGSGMRLVLAILPIVFLTVIGQRHAHEARLVFVHVHNLVGVAVWLFLFRRRGGIALLPLAIVAICAGWLLLSPSPLEWTQRLHGDVAWRLSLLTVADWVAPGLPVRLAVGLAFSYVFLQSVHYSVWLAWIPQEDTRGQGTLTFRMTVRGWLRDFGAVGFAAIVTAGAAVALGAFVEVHRARALYLSLAMFHGYLELAAIAYFLTRGGAPGTRESGELRVATA